MKPFNHSVALRVISCSSASICAKSATEMIPEMRFKLRSLVRNYNGWDAKSANPLGNKTICDGLRSYRGKWVNLGPAGKSVDHCEQVSIIAGRRQRSDNVNVDGMKSSDGRDSL